MAAMRHVSIFSLPALLLLWITPPALCQDTDTLFLNYFPFNRRIDVSNYRGLPFRMQAAVRVEVTDSDAAAFLWVRINRNDGSMAFLDIMEHRPIREKQWKLYSIEGLIDSNAQLLSFGGLVNYNGKFYFDEFTLTVKDKAGRWKDVALLNSGFESDSSTAWSFEKKDFYIKGFHTEKSTIGAYRGNKCLLIQGEGVPNYGVNTKQGKYVTVNGVSHYYEIYGEGPPLLLLHGNGQSIGAFLEQIPFFSKHYQVIAVDSRGRGKSGDNNEELTYELEASDINAFLDSLQMDSVNIIGWSDGGIIGLIMAMKYPGKVRALVSSGANIQQDTSVFFPDYLKAMEDIVANPNASPLSRKLNNLMIKYPNIQFSDLSKITCPVLITAGDKDDIRIEHTVKISQAIPNSQLCIFPGTSHYVLSDNPKLFNEIALKFLQSR